MLTDRAIDPRDFRATVRSYVTALERGNIHALRHVVSDDADICVVLRAGLHIRGKCATLDYYRRAFGRQGWRYRATVRWSMQSGDSAVALVEGTEMGETFEEVLFFNRHDSGWHLIFARHAGAS